MQYCSSEFVDRRQRHGLSPRDENKYPKQCYNSHQRIPRFERNRTTSTEGAALRSLYAGSRTVTGSLNIKCSNLSASCSSLSSISSSGSSSPPLPASPPPCNNVAWKVPSFNHDTAALSSVSPWSQTAERGVKSYSNVRHGKNKPTRLFDNSSLFCTQVDADKRQRENTNIQGAQNAGEYTLFGAHSFGNAFKSPIM